MHARCCCLTCCVWRCGVHTYTHYLFPYVGVPTPATSLTRTTNIVPVSLCRSPHPCIIVQKT